MADKGKKGSVDDDHLDKDLILTIEKLQEIQDELDKVNEEASDRVLEVEQQYNEIRRPVYEKRNSTIQAIPDFWLTAFLSHPALLDFLTEEDQKVFKYLQSLDVEDFKDVMSGYRITFTFRPNPYFEDTELVKVFRFSDEDTTLISGSTVKWKDGMDLTNGVGPVKDGRKRALQEESFFNWFSATQLKDASGVMHDELPSLASRISLFAELVNNKHYLQLLSLANRIAEIIKEDLWPNPLRYFNNEADGEDYEDDDDNDDDEELGKGNEGTEEDDEEQDEDDEVDDA